MLDDELAASHQPVLDVGISTRGLHMEDRVLANLGIRLFGVFDGVGGHGHGATAARLAVDSVHAWVSQYLAVPTTVREAQEVLAAALAEADQAIAAFNSEQPANMPSATTAALALIFRPERLPPPDQVVVLATLGDSRVQLLRDDNLYTLTLDHSAISDPDPLKAKARQDRLDDARSLDDLSNPVDKAAFSQRHLISGALSGRGSGDSRFYALRLLPGDRLLIDSDGVHDNLRSEELTSLAGRSPFPQEAADAVSDGAWERSGHNPAINQRAKPDDVSVVVVDIPEK